MLCKSLLFFYFVFQSTFMDQRDIIKEIGQIRSIMEKSSKFISISGLSGVLIGTYAIIGAALGYITVYGFRSQFGYRDYFVTDEHIIFKLLLIALTVLLISIITGVLMAKRKAKRVNQSIWNVSSRSLLFALAVPLMAGGIFSLIVFARGYYGLIASSLLIFYGLALTAASTYTFKEVKWLGIFEIILGLLALCFPGYGFWFWTFGFGVLHIIYGLIVYKRYE